MWWGVKTKKPTYVVKRPLPKGRSSVNPGVRYVNIRHQLESENGFLRAGYFLRSKRDPFLEAFESVCNPDPDSMSIKELQHENNLLQTMLEAEREDRPLHSGIRNSGFGTVIIESPDGDPVFQTRPVAGRKDINFKGGAFGEHLASVGFPRDQCLDNSESLVGAAVLLPSSLISTLKLQVPDQDVSIVPMIPSSSLDAVEVQTQNNLDLIEKAVCFEKTFDLQSAQKELYALRRQTMDLYNGYVCIQWQNVLEGLVAKTEHCFPGPDILMSNISKVRTSAAFQKLKHDSLKQKTELEEENAIQLKIREQGVGECPAEAFESRIVDSSVVIPEQVVSCPSEANAFDMPAVVIEMPETTPLETWVTGTPVIALEPHVSPALDVWTDELSAVALEVPVFSAPAICIVEYPVDALALSVVAVTPDLGGTVATSELSAVTTKVLEAPVSELSIVTSGLPVAVPEESATPASGVSVAGLLVAAPELFVVATEAAVAAAELASFGSASLGAVLSDSEVTVSLQLDTTAINFFEAAAAAFPVLGSTLPGPASQGEVAVSAAAGALVAPVDEFDCAIPSSVPSPAVCALAADDLLDGDSVLLPSAFPLHGSPGSPLCGLSLSGLPVIETVASLVQDSLSVGSGGDLGSGVVSSGLLGTAGDACRSVGVCSLPSDSGRGVRLVAGCELSCLATALPGTDRGVRSSSFGSLIRGSLGRAPPVVGGALGLGLQQGEALLRTRYPLSTQSFGVRVGHALAPWMGPCLVLGHTYVCPWGGILSGFGLSAIRWRPRDPWVRTFHTPAGFGSTSDPNSSFALRLCSSICNTFMMHYGPSSPSCVQTLFRSRSGGGILFPRLFPQFYGCSDPLGFPFSTFPSLGSIEYSVPGFPSFLSCASWLCSCIQLPFHGWFFNSLHLALALHLCPSPEPSAI